MLYRRADAIQYYLRPCDRAKIGVEVPSRGAESMISRDEALLLGRMNHWHTAEELGVAETVLQSLVVRHLAYFFEGKRPRHVLSTRPLERREGPIALRRNLRMLLLFGKHGEPVQQLPFMPRRGLLDRAELAGVVFGVWEHDEQTASIRVSCCARHAQALRDLIPRLDGRHRFSELADGAEGEVLDLLDLTGLLEAFSPPAHEGRNAQVTWLGHASVLYEAGGKRFVVDPLFHGGSQPPRKTIAPPKPQPFDPRRLGSVDGILITHGDNDHLHAESLLRFSAETPIYLPSSTKKMAYQVDLEGVARLCGFKQIVMCDEWQRIPVGEVELVAAPFVGEDWGLQLPKRTWLISHPSLTIYCSADSAFMPEVYRKLAAENRRVDLAFLGVAGCSEPHVSPRDLGYGYFYLEWIPSERVNQWIELTCGPEESAEAARLLGARRAFGYAAGSGHMTMGYSDRGTPAELAEALRESESEPIDLPLGEPRSF
jgi:L-ascorbate metabolism protein UlaG (beta-lactamase superfamily)